MPPAQLAVRFDDLGDWVGIPRALEPAETAPITRVSLGNYGTSPIAYDVWYDDLVIANHPISCSD